LGLSAPVGLYEIRQILGAEPENPDDERVAVSHGDGRQKKHDKQLIPGEHDACVITDEVIVHTDRNHNVTVSVVVQRVRRTLFIQHTCTVETSYIVVQKEESLYFIQRNGT